MRREDSHKMHLHAKTINVLKALADDEEWFAKLNIVLDKIEQESNKGLFYYTISPKDIKEIGKDILPQIINYLVKVKHYNIEENYTISWF